MFRLSLFLILLSFFCIAQEKSYPEIDSALSKIYFTTHETGKFRVGIDTTYKLIADSKKMGYDKGMVKGYINIGNFLSTINRYEESLKYFELAEKKINNVKDNQLKALLYIEYGKVNRSLGLYEIALAQYNKAIYAGKKVSDIPEQKVVLQYAYTCKADNFTSLNQIDSMYIYFQKGYKLYPDALTAANIANYFIIYKKQEIDSADFYLKTAIAEIDKTDLQSYEKLCVLSIYGDFYSAKENYHSALEYYFKALKVATAMKSSDERRNLYKLISKTYNKINDNNNAVEYLNKYTIINDSLNSADKKALNLSVGKFVKDKESEREHEKKVLKNRTDFTIGIISGVALALIIFTYYFYKKKKKEKEIKILRQQEEILQTKIEKRNLEYKVNDAFDEVLALAKKNDPTFLARFKEVYPEFCERLLNRYPDIIASEFIFCAYLKLNFSTKEISSQTFVTEKTVQSRKSRLRKRMNIPSHEDLYIWISKI